MTKNFEIQDLNLQGLKLITPFFVEDDRGYFLKSAERDVYKQWGLDLDIYEDFESYSVKGVIRGLHFQTYMPQIKIVRAIRGNIHDVVVDLRKDSATFGQYADVVLSDSNHNILWIPEGFAHGFEVLSDDAIMSYKCVGKYQKGYDTGIVWNDAELGIQWQTQKPIVSERDAQLMSFRKFREEFKGL